MDRLLPEDAFRQALGDATSRALGVRPDAVPLTYPPNAELGDLASPICFDLARTLRKPPRALAEAIAAAFEPAGGIERVVVAGAGYLNGFLDREAFLRRWLVVDRRVPDPHGTKSIVEHTNINPNKAAHIGHLRNAVLGDTLARGLRALGRPVEVQNYIDDTGVQVADLVVGFTVLRCLGLDDIRKKYAEERLGEQGERFDYIAWDLYAEVTRFYREDETRLAHRRETLHAMERGNGEIAALAAWVSDRMVRYHLVTMDRIGVRYDLLPRESDILAAGFWQAAFERLRAAGAIELATEGKLTGCWIMRLHGAQSGAGEDEKVIVRSDGTVTYVGKDIAYQLWKHGLLGRDFSYRRWDWSGCAELYPVWTTKSERGIWGPHGGPGSAATDVPPFGAGERVYNVIDSRQSFLQRVVSQGLRELGHPDEADRSIHYSYEMVALSPPAVAALFPDLELDEEERGKPYVEMSGRRGLGVRADDLLDALRARARDEVAKRNTDMEAGTLDETARRIAVGALRYYMLRFTRNRVVAFDLDAALAFEGETGPYLQYSVVRARNILVKARRELGDEATEPRSLAARVRLGALPDETRAEHWSLPFELARAIAVLHQAIDSLELSSLAKHAHVLAQSFNTFYHRNPVVQETNAEVRDTRLAVVRLYHDGMVELLGWMGIEVPDRM